MACSIGHLKIVVEFPRGAPLAGYETAAGAYFARGTDDARAGASGLGIAPSRARPTTSVPGLRIRPRRAHFAMTARA